MGNTQSPHSSTLNSRETTTSITEHIESSSKEGHEDSHHRIRRQLRRSLSLRKLNFNKRAEFSPKKTGRSSAEPPPSSDVGNEDVVDDGVDTRINSNTSPDLNGSNDKSDLSNNESPPRSRDQQQSFGRVNHVYQSLRKSFRKRSKSGRHQKSSSSSSNNNNSNVAQGDPSVWKSDDTLVRSGACYFNVKYVGNIEVFESRGMKVCEEAMRRLLNRGGKCSRAVLYVHGDGLRVVDSKTQGLLVDQVIEKVSFCAPDRHNERFFSYICRDGTTRRWICHSFLAKFPDTGERLSHAVGCAFAICLERKMERDKINDEAHDRRRIEKREEELRKQNEEKNKLKNDDSLSEHLSTEGDKKSNHSSDDLKKISLTDKLNDPQMCKRPIPKVPIFAAAASTTNAISSVYSPPPHWTNVEEDDESNNGKRGEVSSINHNIDHSNNRLLAIKRPLTSSSTTPFSRQPSLMILKPPPSSMNGSSRLSSDARRKNLSLNVKHSGVMMQTPYSRSKQISSNGDSNSDLLNKTAPSIDLLSVSPEHNILSNVQTGQDNSNERQISFFSNLSLLENSGVNLSSLNEDVSLPQTQTLQPIKLYHSKNEIEKEKGEDSTKSNFDQTNERTDKIEPRLEPLVESIDEHDIPQQMLVNENNNDVKIGVTNPWDMVPDQPRSSGDFDVHWNEGHMQQHQSESSDFGKNQ